MAGLRIGFMGSPDFAVPALAALIGAGHEIVCVYTQPPRPSGRGHRETPTAVHAFAADRGLPVRTPGSLRTAEAAEAFAALDLDLAVVAAYGLILPVPILHAPRLGCLNIHASLLPRWRGAAPIQRAILAGDDQTGVTIMQMEAGLDTGPILLARATSITSETTASDLHDTLSALGAELIVEAIEGVVDGRLTPAPQPKEGVTYAAKIVPADGRIDWMDAAYILRQLRALTPRPGVWFTHQGERLRVLAAEEIPNRLGARPGTVIDSRLGVACAKGAIRLTRLQRPGRAALDAEDFLRGFPLPCGTTL